MKFTSLLHRLPPTLSSRRRGFTLLELLVVVAVIAMIAAILIPAITKVRHNTKAKERKAVAALATPNHQHPLHSKKDQVLLADLSRFDLDLTLSTSFQRVGMELFPVQRLIASGEVVVDRGSEHFDIFVPFPQGTESVRQASVWWKTDGGRQRVRNVAVSRHGMLIRESGGGEALEVAFDLSLAGNIQWPLPPVRLENVNIRLQPGVASAALPVVDEGSLPAQVEAGQLVWTFPQLVTSGSLLLSTPTGTAPMGHSLLLFRLTGLAVLLFGAGFWYLAEQDTPGLLRDFRWGHFLLLALTYSQFFVVFAVLAIFGNMGAFLAMVIAAVVSLPLLGFHVAKIVSPRFALLRILPFAALTLLAVIAGVYAGPARPFVILAVGVLCMSYMTITYSQWLARTENRAETTDASLLHVRQRYVSEVTETLVAQAAVLDTQTDLALATEDGNAVSMARKLVEESRAELWSVLNSRKHIEATLEHAALPSSQIENRMARLQERLQGAMHTLETMTGVLDRCRSLTAK